MAGKVLLMCPCGDGRIETLTVMSLIQAISASAPHVLGPHFLNGNSNIHDARNTMAHIFKTQHTECDRVVFVDSDIAFDLQDFTYLMEGDEDIVIAPYARKAIGEAHVEWGMGLVRIHRSVFERMDAWRDDEGAEMLHRYYSKYGIVTDYFFTGATSDSRWFGEDTGFYHWCALMGGVSMRQEKRTRLVHIGKFYYCYPDQTPGLIPITAGAQ